MIAGPESEPQIATGQIATGQPAAVTRGEVEDAARRLGGRVRRTPVMAVEAGLLGAAPVLLKLEQLQHTGSFKARGALNALLTAGAAAGTGVVAASGGNHGLAVAWAAGQVGATATVFVPRTAPEPKVAGLRALGADVRLVGDRYSAALEAARGHARATGALSVHAYDERPVVAGQGTVALELLEQAPLVRAPGGASGGIDTLLVAVGGGGLAAGTAAAMDRAVRVVGVEPQGCPTWNRAREAGRPVEVEVGGLGADALGASRLGDIPWATLTAAGARSVLVAPADVAAARRLLWDRLHLAVEPGGAVAVAALLAGAYQPGPHERVAVILCGANADPGDLAAPGDTQVDGG